MLRVVFDPLMRCYIIWTQKSGFCPEVVLEIEQLAVSPNHQRKGTGRSLIINSLPLVKAKLAENDSVLKHIFVTTRADNFAQELYKSTLGAEVEVTITNLYSADEVLMITRNVSYAINISAKSNTLKIEGKENTSIYNAKINGKKSLGELK